MTTQAKMIYFRYIKTYSIVGQSDIPDESREIFMKNDTS